MVDRRKCFSSISLRCQSIEFQSADFMFQVISRESNVHEAISMGISALRPEMVAGRGCMG